MHAGLDSFLVKVQTVRDSFTTYRRSNTKDLFQPYSPAPEKIKALTDKTKALYEDLLRMKRNIVMERIKLREGKLLAVVEHELKHYFGRPYENNYYTGMTQVSFIHTLIHLSIHLSLRPSFHPIYPCTYPFTHLSIRQSARQSIPTSVLPFIHPSVRLSVPPSVRLSLSPSSNLSFRLSVHLYVRLSVCPFIPQSIDPSAYPLYVRSSVTYSHRFSVHPFSHTSVRLLLIGRAAWDICFSQSEVLLRWFPRGHFAGKPVVVLRNGYD